MVIGEASLPQEPIKRRDFNPSQNPDLLRSQVKARVLNLLNANPSDPISKMVDTAPDDRIRGFERFAGSFLKHAHGQLGNETLRNILRVYFDPKTDPTLLGALENLRSVFASSHEAADDEFNLGHNFDALNSANKSHQEILKAQGLPLETSIDSLVGHVILHNSQELKKDREELESLDFKKYEDRPLNSFSGMLQVYKEAFKAKNAEDLRKKINTVMKKKEARASYFKFLGSRVPLHLRLVFDIVLSAAQIDIFDGLWLNSCDDLAEKILEASQRIDKFFEDKEKKKFLLQESFDYLCKRFDSCDGSERDKRKYIYALSVALGNISKEDFIELHSLIKNPNFPLDNLGTLETIKKEIHDLI